MSGQTTVTSYLYPSAGAVSATAAAGSAATCTVPAAGSGLSNYITALSIEVVASATVSGTAPNIVTSTGITGTPSFNMAGALAAGAIDRYVITFPSPLKGSAANTAVVFTSPAVTSLLFRITAYYYTDV
jgi:hypothetical protein